MRLALRALPKCALAGLSPPRYSRSFRSPTTRILSQRAERVGRGSTGSGTHAACCHSCLCLGHRGPSGRRVEVSSQKCRCLSTDSSNVSVSSTVSELFNQSPINKEHGGTVMTEQLYSYLLAHTREPEVLRWLRQETAVQFPVGARMQVSPEQGQFMAWLVQATGACKALELGVFTGYSALAVALALPEQGKLVACDRDPRALQLAQTAFAKGGVAHKVEVRQGMALEVLQDLLQQPGEAGSYDFAFIDADKRAYADYFELCLKLLRHRGILALDNVLWYGKVADPTEQDKKTSALRKLNASLLKDKRIRLSIVPIGDGMALCTKL